MPRAHPWRPGPRVGLLELVQRPGVPERFWSLVRKGDGCWVWLGRTKQRDGRAEFVCRGYWSYIAARVAWVLTHGTDPGESFVLHRCDNPACVRPDHLFLGTQTVNMADRQAKGRQPKGEAIPWARLTEADVRVIRTRTEPVATLAERLRVSVRTVRNVIEHRTWRHVA